MLLPYMNSGVVEAGCDEAGRGCLAGAGYALRPLIEEAALAWAVGIVTPQEIDRINILNASFLAMHRAIEQLRVTPQHLLIDGNRFKPYPGIAHTCVVKGDGK